MNSRLFSCLALICLLAACSKKEEISSPPPPKAASEPTGAASSAIPATGPAAAPASPQTNVVAQPTAPTKEQADVRKAVTGFADAAQTAATKPAVVPESRSASPEGRLPLSLADLSSDQVTRGLKEALSKGLDRAIGSLGSPGGFLTNLSVRIPMPEKLQSVEKALRTLGQDQLADEFVTTMNRAAEQAVPAAAEVFVGVLKSMTVEDAKAILAGPKDAATEFFRRNTGAALAAKFLPIVQQATAKSGATAAYKQVLDKAKLAGPFLSIPSLDLDTYVTGKAMDGLFKMVAEEEKHIRENPLARGTDLLKSVFGALGR